MRRVVHFATAAGTPVTGSAEQSIAGYDFGVGELTPGRIVEFRCAVLITGVSPGDTLRMRIRFGTSATASSNTGIMTGDAIAVAVGDSMQAWGEICIQSTTRYVFSTLADNPHATGSVRDTDSAVVVYTAVADTAYYLDITADWSTLDAANTVQAESWVIYEDEV
jgi:hypothetical protein